MWDYFVMNFDRASELQQFGYFCFCDKFCLKESLSCTCKRCYFSQLSTQELIPPTTVKDFSSPVISNKIVIGVWNGFSKGTYPLRAHHIWIISFWIRWSNTPFDSRPLWHGLSVTFIFLVPEIFEELFSYHATSIEGVKKECLCQVERAHRTKIDWLSLVIPFHFKWKWFIRLFYLKGNKIMLFCVRRWEMVLLRFPLT